MYNKTYNKYEIYNKNKTSYNMNIKRIIRISTFTTFQQPYLSFALQILVTLQLHCMEYRVI